MRESFKLSMEGVDKYYGRIVALRGVSLTLREGELVVLLGENGSGKSTLLKIASRILRPSRGIVKYGYEKGAYVPEVIPPLDPRMAIFDLAALYKSVYGHLETKYLKSFRVEEIDRSFRSLSKGMRRKVLLALALGSRAEVLFLDEPYMGLDPPSARMLSQALEGRTGIIATHLIQHIPESYSRILVMHAGRIVRELEEVPEVVQSPEGCGNPIPLGEGMWICLS